LEEFFGVDKPIIGMVHLPPLPGSVPYRGESMDEIMDFVLADATKLVEGGVNGLIVENMWDLPYHVGLDVPPEEIAAQAIAAREVVAMVDLPVGINVIHNGWRAELGIAVASGAKFVRICLLTGAMVWDTGEIDHGVATKLLELRKTMGADQIRIFADVHKKHAVMFPGIDLETHAEWTDFFMADALIVTGKMTGGPPTVEDLRRVKQHVPQRPLLVGSGLNPENAREFFEFADGAIVGTYLKEKGVTQNPVDGSRVKKLMKVVQEIRKASA
ncbi:MAG: BtpA/SgcQ family protein, partial [Candidatus Geothermarchaeales archaeon]